MADNKLKDSVLACSIEIWFSDPRGSSSSEVAGRLDVDHENVKEAMLALEADGKGKVKRDVTLYSVNISIGEERNDVSFTEIPTHILFPSEESLKTAYYQSGLPESEPPEYTRRLHLGASQVGEVFFSEDVLERYFNYPQYYEVLDTLSGGDILSTNDAPAARFIHVQYGKVRLSDETVVVAAIYSDLGDMSEHEQSYWKAHELHDAAIDPNDEHYKRFVQQAFLGEFVEVANPISEVFKQVCAFNDAIGDAPVLTVESNIDLRVPVLRTYKAFCNACSELYKVIGPDALKTKRLRSVLTDKLGVSLEQLSHQSGRPLSPTQLMGLLEEVLGQQGAFTPHLSRVKDFRIEADHKVVEPGKPMKSYSRDFAELCSQIAVGLKALTNAYYEAVS